MKTSAIIRIVIWLIILLFLIGVLIYGINGDNTLRFNLNLNVHSYSNSDRYTIGKDIITVKDISSIDINWISGNIEIVEYDGEYIEFYEEYHSNLSENNRLRYLVDNGKLIIQFKESKRIFGFSFFNTLHKNLTMKIPTSLIIELNPS